MATARVEYYHDQNGQWRSKVIAANGKILMVTPEGYFNLTDCRETTEKCLSGGYASALSDSTITYPLSENQNCPPTKLGTPVTAGSETMTQGRPTLPGY